MVLVSRGSFQQPGQGGSHSLRGLGHLTPVHTPGGAEEGWEAAPPGTRKSLYENPNYQAAAPFSKRVLQAIQTADPNDSSARPTPYLGVQIVDIPEFRRIAERHGYLSH